MLQNNVVLYIVATLLARLFDNVVKITFFKRYTTLYLRCVFAGKVVCSSILYVYIKKKTIAIQ